MRGGRGEGGGGDEDVKRCRSGLNPSDCPRASRRPGAAAGEPAASPHSAALGRSHDCELASWRRGLELELSWLGWGGGGVKEGGWGRSCGGKDGRLVGGGRCRFS